jgi:hypothetical protein
MANEAQIAAVEAALASVEASIARLEELRDGPGGATNAAALSAAISSLETKRTALQFQLASLKAAAVVVPAPGAPGAAMGVAGPGRAAAAARAAAPGPQSSLAALTFARHAGALADVTLRTIEGARKPTPRKPGRKIAKHR